MLFLLLALAACAPQSADRPPPAHRDADDAEVYAVALAAVADGYSQPVLLIQRETEPPQSLNREESARERFSSQHRRALSGLQRETERSFWERNAAPDTLPRSLERGRRRLIDSARWREREEYPVFLLSQPGYSHDGTQALIHVIASCPLCGGADYLLLRREGTRWTIVARSNDWVS